MRRMFGWWTFEQPLGEICSVYCLNCQRQSRWEVWNESGWLTLCDIRVVRFVHEHELQCTSCSSAIVLHPSEFKQIDRHMREHESIDDTPMYAPLVRRIEQEQLAGKTLLQFKFIRESLKARREYHELMAAREKRM